MQYVLNMGSTNKILKNIIFFPYPKSKWFNTLSILMIFMKNEYNLEI